jgi:hypothetical protein
MKKLIITQPISQLAFIPALTSEKTLAKTIQSISVAQFLLSLI